MEYTPIQYEFRNKWIHISWGKKLFASDDEHFDRVHNVIFWIKDGSRELIYPSAASLLKKRERDASRKAFSLYKSSSSFPQPWQSSPSASSPVSNRMKWQS